MDKELEDALEKIGKAKSKAKCAIEKIQEDRKDAKKKLAA